MATSSIKEQVYQELSRVTHAISNPKRMELIDVLSQKSYSVEELSNEITMSMASTSQHLQVLKSAKLVDSYRQGNFIIYSITDDSVLKLVSVVKELGFRKIAEIERLIGDFKADKNILESITLDDLLARSKKEKIILIDVRPEDEYKAGHIPNAVSIPLAQLKKRLNELPKNRTIIAYCRGPLCVMSADAIKLLNQRKFTAIRMEDGYVEWKLKQHEINKN
ncbi:MAG: metalloregulator ArsR/SmtB family transcription factor [Chitinophagaceae bacterium]|nr:metalloregulator ArsR/SmtB family transcription factor [Chitinophagaceae bacterium]MDP1764335.1 metalloregulator ArsR/SmtB family transcription factor [Sediminibacterium sp.]MDP1812535.1 metalloregulator ArsR/SmtB family transcription factor [Sediminibacterium sp.]MDP3128292.1 metalloregulator ArsR/SmtB family transcription factor [Sediminibacterium sp.]MDP3665414.1 metalloregulator ArsR/SmtB family transcription factor [Sediminibacterium sp.]